MIYVQPQTSFRCEPIQPKRAYTRTCGLRFRLCVCMCMNMCVCERVRKYDAHRNGIDFKLVQSSETNFRKKERTNESKERK